MRIRRATLKDLDAITEIYNDAIVKTSATFDTEPKTLREQEAWFKHHDEKHPILVAVEGQLVVGWASLSPWSDRCAYSGTAEVSVYVRSEYRGKGVGGKLLRAVMDEGEKAGLHTVIARITAGNEASLSLHREAGFVHVGTLKEVGNKFDTLLDVHMMQFIYSKK